MGMDGYLRKRFINLHDAKYAKSAKEIKEPLIISFFVIPANAGIQKVQGHGCRPTPA
jgi:hypothetical protein